MSESENHRQRGNNLYRMATDEFCAAVQEERVKKALLNYDLALKTAKTAEERAFASKNIAVASWKLSKLVRNTNGLVNFYHKEAMKNFSAAWHNGSFDVKWQTNLEATWLRFVDELLDWTADEYPMRERSQSLYEVLSLTHNDVVKSKIFLHLAENLFHAGVTALQKGEFKECLNCMHECHYPIEQILKIGTEADKSDAEVLKSDVLMTLSIGESAQFIFKGDQFLQLAYSGATVDFRYVWDAIDCHRSAIISTRELDIEQEAIANSKLAQTFHKALNDKWRAKECATLAIQLSQMLAPRNFLMNDWYKEAANIVQFYQEEQLAAENLKWENRRKPILEELKKELEEINSAELQTSVGHFRHVDVRKFLKLIYAKFPPKHKETSSLDVDPTKLDDSQLKKVVKYVMIDYHPDGIDEDQHGIQHKVLCEEIYKIVSNEYNYMKGVD